MECSTFISCVRWVERGYAAHVPKQIQMSKEEVEALLQDPMIAQELQQDLPNFCDVMDHGPSPYPSAIENISDDQKEDYFIKDSDALIIAGKVEKEHAALEIYIYEMGANNMFVHHQIMLSSFPLDIEWLKVSLGSINSNEPTKGNYAVVSSFLPEIEVWNLDLVEAIEPDAILGGQMQSKKKPKKFSNKVKKYKQGSHTDAVQSISLNSTNLGILASCSADHTVKIWDIPMQTNIYTLRHHTSSVNKVQWSASDPSVLFSCSKGITVNDSRYPNDFIDIQVKGNLESACWNPNNPSQIGYVTAEGGLHLMDVRQPKSAVLMVQAHTGSVNDIVIGGSNLCYTCSEDEYVRVWSLLDTTAPIAAKNPKCGTLFCMDLVQLEEGPVLSVGNSKGELFVWDVTENEQINGQIMK